MKRIIGLMLLTIFTVGIWLPASASAATSPQIYVQRERRYRDYDRDRDRDRYRAYRRMRRRQQQMSYYGYRNYGQYRRTMVGNRRWRWVNQTYYRNGYAYTRRVRVFY